RSDPVAERRLIAWQIAATMAAQIDSQLQRHALPSATLKPWCERPQSFRAGPPCVLDAGVVHTTACSPSATPWRSGGRQKAPPERGDAADKCLSGFAIGERGASGD